MIAVFCKNENYFIELGATPKNVFKRIRSIEDVRGIKFTGVLAISGWYVDSPKICEAYDALEKRQPELFN